jgi:cardiolipin synthase
MHVRTSQGTIAWIACLIAFPWLAVPLYWFAGKSRFSGYVRARRGLDAKLRQLADDLHRRLRHYAIQPDDAFGRAAEVLGGLPFTRGNELTLLIDGEETFDAIFRSIAAAERYLLINFYIVKHDRLGRRFFIDPQSDQRVFRQADIVSGARKRDFEQWEKEHPELAAKWKQQSAAAAAGLR